MSEEEIVACDQCKQVPDNYLSLNCNHCFCLICMAQNFLKGGRIFKLEGTDNIHYICTVCEKDTPLDDGSVSVVESICHQLIQTSLEKVREDQNQIKEDKPLQQSQTIIQPLPQPKCDIHTKEDATLFCFTCENKCFCIKCLLRHDNKTHEIQNVNSCLKRLKSKMNDATHTIGASLELMQLQLKRVQDQDSTLQEEMDYLIQRVQEQFQSLYQVIQNKEKEILTQLDNLKEIQEQQTEKMLNDIQMKINSLIQLRSDFENIGLSESLQPSVSILNYYSGCKQIMQKVIGQMSFSDIFSTVKYFPDNEQFFRYDEFELKMQNLKAQIDRFFNQQRSVSQHEKQSRITQKSAIIDQLYLSQRCHTQMDESTDSFKSHQVSTYSKINTPINNQRNLQAKVDEIKQLYSDRVKTQQKLQKQQENSLNNIQRSFSELASFKKQTALSALRLQQGLFDSRVTKKLQQSQQQQIQESQQVQK
ncbi:unnamed protein product [Paramecium primaurelia]|uniref:B box-type domain-containing protein n=1 Tax=Paramecium primaurelia TaxID=5886 RepID=A0A8S1N9M0_PARPR|nr:unnamed protein product [Paramecium primaurelia]